MGADRWEDCPCCNSERAVRVDNMYDVELYDDGTLIPGLTAYCTVCKKKFKLKIE